MRSSQSLRGRLIVGITLGVLGAGGIGAVIVGHAIIRHPDVVGLMHNAAFTIMTVGFIVLGLSLIRRSLSPLEKLRMRLGDVREGRERRLEGAYPSEVQPLVTDLNALLDQREQAITRAAAKAGDLAHGLKTPLAVLAQEAERAEAAGQRDLAAAIGEQVHRMRRQIDYHLAHARATAAGGTSVTRTNVTEAADGVARVLRRLYAERSLELSLDIPSALAVRTEREDLEEMLGNLLDNACKWARTRVVVTGAATASRVTITVDDDGPGLDPSKWEVVLQRGVRADQAAPGSGLGLAIVRELAEVYGGSVKLDKAPIGGLRATLELEP